MEELFLLSVLKIPYLLLHRYTAKTRDKFNQEHPYLEKLYSYLLKFIGRELRLPVKRCKICKINFLPNHRVKGHQKCCPYGCVELNRRRNKREAKSRYRKKHEAKILASGYNHLYRERKQNGQVTEVPETSFKIEEVERRLKGEIKFLYKKLNPGVNSRKLKQLDRILRKLSQRISTA